MSTKPIKQLRKPLREVPRQQWPNPANTRIPNRVLTNGDFLVQVFHDPEATRISVNRTRTTAGGHWKDGISWDELQRIKAGCGYGEALALEVYPEDSELVNDAAIRHLFICQVRPNFAWTRRNRHG